MTHVKNIVDDIRERGLFFVFKRRLAKMAGKKIRKFGYLNRLFAGKTGLEVGGPSEIFRDNGFIPLYKVVKELDGCNFSNKTIWEGHIENGDAYPYYPNKKGVQYISEATDLSLIRDSTYDFVISSNCLEHVANPLKAVREWIRVIKDNGLLLLVLPNKEYCFDHNRQVTPFSHLLEDFQNDTQEDDLTHLDEILQFHDLTMDVAVGSPEQFRERSLKNFDNRALHQHVFDTSTLKEIFGYFRLEILLTHAGRDYTILGRKIVD
jgi:SAM-dependent methyltransferase